MGQLVIKIICWKNASFLSTTIKVHNGHMHACNNQTQINNNNNNNTQNPDGIRHAIITKHGIKRQRRQRAPSPPPCCCPRRWRQGNPGVKRPALSSPFEISLRTGCGKASVMQSNWKATAMTCARVLVSMWKTQLREQQPAPYAGTHGQQTECAKP